MFQVALPLHPRKYKGGGMGGRLKIVHLNILPNKVIWKWRLLWMDQISLSICGLVWWRFEHLCSQPQWRCGAPREEGTVCSTFVRSVPADCTCSLCHQQLGIEAFWRAAAVRSRAWENCGKRKQAILPRRSWRDMSVSENCLSWIWGWTLAKHIKGNWVRSFDFFFPLIPLKACISFLPVFPISMYANFLPLTYWKGKMHLNKQLWLQPLC